MKKKTLFVMMAFSSLSAFAQEASNKTDNSFKIVGIVSLLGALFLAIRSLRNNYKK